MNTAVDSLMCKPILAKDFHVPASSNISVSLRNAYRNTKRLLTTNGQIMVDQVYQC